MNRRLVRNTHNEVLGGVCSGVADYFGWDPTWIRVAAALSILIFAGTPILVYIIMWIVIPADTSVYPQNGWGQGNYQDGYNQGYAQGWQQEQANQNGQYNYNQYQQGYQQGYDQAQNQNWNDPNAPRA